MRNSDFGYWRDHALRAWRCVRACVESMTLRER